MFVKITHTAIYSDINIVYKFKDDKSMFGKFRIKSLPFGHHHLSLGVNEIDGETLMYQINGTIPQNLIGVKWADVVAFELISPTGVERVMLDHSVGHTSQLDIWEDQMKARHDELFEEIDSGLAAGITFMHLLEQI